MTHADGQKIAKKLAISITKETKRTKQFLEEYNSTLPQLNSSDCPVRLNEVLQLDSNFWTPSINVSSHPSIPWNVKKDIIQAFLMLQRSKEEMVLLQADMIATVSYWHKRRNLITKTIEELELSGSSEDSYIRGAKCILQQCRWEAELLQCKSVIAFGNCISLPSELVQVQHSESESDLSDDDSSDSELDSDGSIANNNSYKNFTMLRYLNKVSVQALRIHCLLLLYC